jgi:hypothetical protein
VFRGRDLHWFNTRTRSFEMLSIPDRTLTVAAGEADASGARRDLDVELPSTGLAVLAALAAGLVVLARRLRPAIAAAPVAARARAQIRRWRRRRAYGAACRRGDAVRCVALLYEHLGEAGPVQLGALYRADIERYRIYEHLVRSAYTGAAPPAGGELLRLWNRGTSSQGPRPAASPVLRLNPVASKSDAPRP